MTGPLPHCPKNNLNHPVKTEPVTVGADTLFLFLSYLHRTGGPRVFIHLFVQYSQLNLPTLDPKWGGIGRRFKTVTLTTGPPHLLCKGSRYCTVQYNWYGWFLCPKASHALLHPLQPWPARIVCRDSDYFWHSVYCMWDKPPPPPQRMILVFIQ